jgi:PAS domain S-box-containing protein
MMGTGLSTGVEIERDPGAQRNPIAAETLEELAQRTIDLVGDGCVIRRADPDTGALVAIAAGHRDPDWDQALRALLDAPPIEPPGGWLGQALERDCLQRLPDLDPDSLAAAGIPPDARIGDVIVVPLRAARAVIVAMRDRFTGPFLSEQCRRLEEMAARTGALLRRDADGEPDPNPEAGGARNAFAPGPEHLLQATSTGIWVVDPRGSTLYVNQAASEVVGWPAHQLRGAPIAEFLGRDPARSRGALDRNGVSERRLTREDGSTVWLQVSARPLLDEHGARSATVYSLVDVTDRHRRELALRLGLQRDNALLGLAEDAAGGLDPDQIFGRAVAIAQEELEVELAAIWEVDEDRELVRSLAHAGWPAEADDGPETEQAGLTLPVSATLRAALDCGEPVLVNFPAATGAGNGSDPVPWPLEAPIRSAAVVPFPDGGRLLSAHSTRRDAIDSDGLRLLESIARVLGPRPLHR